MFMTAQEKADVKAKRAKEAKEARVRKYSEGLMEAFEMVSKDPGLDHQNYNGNPGGMVGMAYYAVGSSPMVQFGNKDSIRELRKIMRLIIRQEVRSLLGG